MLSRRTFLQLAALAAASLPPALSAQESIGLIVPFPAGGGADVLARSVSDALGEALGAHVWIGNRPGAGGIVGTQHLARQRADGSLVGYVTNGILCVNPILYPQTPFDPLVSLEPVGRISEIGLIAVLNPNALPGVKTLEDLIRYARAHPGETAFASSGIGTTSHLGGLLFAEKAGIRMLHVPYRGGAAAILDVLAGRIPFMIDVAPNVLTHIRSGKLIALGASAAERLGAAPEIPTLAEAGLPGVELSAWDGIALPKGADPALVKRFSDALAQALRQPDVAQALQKKGAEPRPGTAADFRAWIAAELPKWAALAREAARAAETF